MEEVWCKALVFRQWLFNTPDKALANSIAGECGIDPFVALIAVCRGFSDPYEIEELLSDDVCMSDPLMMADMPAAAQTINSAVLKGQLIAVYGDYDCDGVTATAMLYDYLRSRGARVTYYIPDRETEGYGISRGAVERLYNKGVNLIVTVDNGINALEEIEFANSLGMSVVVTDHHLPSGSIPSAAAVIDAHRADCPSEYKDMCGTAVAYKLICALEEKSPEELLERYADMVAVATVGDIMPLTGENRMMVKAGLKMLYAGCHPGLDALMEVSGMKEKPITAGGVSFGIVPRLNAAGRMGSADRAVQLLIERDPEAAMELAKEISAENVHRQQIEQEIIEQAADKIESLGYKNDRVIIVDGEEWHPGVLGIAAARIVEKYGRSAVVISSDGDTAVGSARGIDGFSIFECISSAADILLKFGGHEMAAGLTLNTKNIEELRARLNAWAAGKPRPVPTVKIDCRLNPAALSVEMAEAIACFEPFGAGNRTPVFGITGLKLDRITPVGGGKHLRLLFSRDRAVLQAMMFCTSEQDFCFAVGDVVDIAVTMSAGLYNGVKQLNLIIKHIRISGIKDENFPEQLSLYDDFLAGKDNDYTNITPSHDDIGNVFRAYCADGRDKFVVNHMLANLPVGKILIAREILIQIGVLVPDGSQRLKRAEGVRSELGKSEYYIKLTAGGGIRER